VPRERRTITSGSAFERMAGYARAVVDGAWVHVSGTTGFDYATGRIDEDPIAQAERAFANIEVALAEAGAGLADIVRIRWYITRAELFERLAPVFARRLGAIRPAATCLVVGMIDPRIQVEIEVTAHRGGAAPDAGGPPAEPAIAGRPAAA